MDQVLQLTTNKLLSAGSLGIGIMKIGPSHITSTEVIQFKGSHAHIYMHNEGHE